jgi:hypothetical protein
MRRWLLSAAFLVFASSNLFAQTPPTSQASPQNASDPQAVAVVQAAITAAGGATAIGTLQSWTFQAQAEGRIENGPVSANLSVTAPQSSSTAKAPPPWARPRSLFVPALVAAILVKESQDPNFSLHQATPPASVPNSSLVTFSVATKTGAMFPGQRWYFDRTTNLPTRIEFIVPAKIGAMESFPGVVTLSNYQAIGGALYPFQIVTRLLRENATETITLKSVTPSTTAGGAQ